MLFRSDTAPDGTRNFILKGGVKLGTVEYYRIEIESHSGVIGKRYLLLRGMSDDISVHIAFFVCADCRFFAGSCAVEQIDSYEQKQAIV